MSNRSAWNKLYKRNVNGSTQVWWQEQDGGRYRTHSGQLDGKITVSEWTQATPKNVGRANETSSEEQAQVEIEAAYVLKRKKGYRDELAAAERLADPHGHEFEGRQS